MTLCTSSFWLMYNPLIIANFFILAGIREGNPVSPMKLQKLIYFAHGFYLSKYNEPLVNEPVQAWKYGPVMLSVYQVFKIYGNNPITQFPGFYKNATYHELPFPIQQFLNEVWDLLKKYTAIELSTLTHIRQSPWDVVVKSNGAIKSHYLPIDNHLIQDYFQREYAA